MNKFCVTLLFTDPLILIPWRFSEIILLEIRLFLDWEPKYIPLSAVEVSQDKDYVFVYKDGKVTETEVELGDIVEDKVEVKKGLKEGQEIVDNPFLIQDGDKVIKQ